MYMKTTGFFSWFKSFRVKEEESVLSIITQVLPAFLSKCSLHTQPSDFFFKVLSSTGEIHSLKTKQKNRQVFHLGPTMYYTL